MKDDAIEQGSIGMDLVADGVKKIVVEPVVDFARAVVYGSPPKTRENPTEDLVRRGELIRLMAVRAEIKALTSKPNSIPQNPTPQAPLVQASV